GPAGRLPLQRPEVRRRRRDRRRGRPFPAVPDLSRARRLLRIRTRRPPHDRSVAQRGAEDRGDDPDRRKPARRVRQGADRRPRRTGTRTGRRRHPCRSPRSCRRLPHRCPTALRARPSGARRFRGSCGRVSVERLRREGRRSARGRKGGLVDVTTLSAETGWAAGLTPLEALAHRSNLLGADRAVANYGGGNTSSKVTEVDHTGLEIQVLWVKGSGTDLATIAATGFTGLRLDEIVPLRRRDAMTDEEMVEYLARCQVAPGMPRASIETLLH